jgi:hypothetical protein
VKRGDGGARTPLGMVAMVVQPTVETPKNETPVVAENVTVETPANTTESVANVTLETPATEVIVATVTQPVNGTAVNETLPVDETMVGEPANTTEDNQTG